MKNSTTLNDITIISKDLFSEMDFTENGSKEYKQFNFLYNPKFYCLGLEGKDIVLNRINIQGSFKGIGGKVENCQLNEIKVESAYSCTEFYFCNKIDVFKSEFKGGSFACAAFPSSSIIKVENCKLINPKSTGINPSGGSGLNSIPKHLRFINNYIIAGDAINLENGADDALISNNIIYCAPLINKSINNSAIGVQVHDALANNTIKNITIENNSIYSYKNILFGIGINVGNTLGNIIEDVLIFNNKISGANEGVRIENTNSYFASNILVKQNQITCYSFGIRLFNVSNSNFNNNFFKAYYSSWNDNLWGVQIHNCAFINIDSNLTQGFAKHYFQTGKSKAVLIKSPIIEKGNYTKKFTKLFFESNIIADSDKAVLYER
ncbi:MAG: hypothetical protein R2831_01135 [Chitinophagaceae bacterium]